MSKADLPPDVHLTVQNTPFGVFISHTGPLDDRDNQAAWAARALLCRIDGIWADGQPVLLTIETEKAVNPS